MSKIFGTFIVSLTLLFSSNVYAALAFSFELDTTYIEAGPSETFQLNGTLFVAGDSDGPIGGFNFGGPSYGYSGSDFDNYSWEFDMSQFEGVVLNPGDSLAVSFGPFIPVTPSSLGLRTIMFPSLAFIDFGDTPDDWETWEWYHASAADVTVNIIDSEPSSDVPEPSSLFLLAAAGWAALFVRRFIRG
ncbi:MAG TPA: PEP-CTERM sorting domain-containing protein [Burkholderiales bacterium]|nr:PEP-CTERM sorting domain-containing protein [Burkholderiales bacterium]